MRAECWVMIAGLAAGMMTGLPGCALNGRSAYSTLGEGERDTARAQELTHQAMEAVGSDPKEAERLLREALTADLYYGPAHNNLGVLYLKQGQLYEAAEEFQWAKKLLPGHPDPRLNLALTLERAGHTDEAIATCRTALEVYPEHIATMQALARLELRSGKTDEGTPKLLEAIALRGETPAWREWAKERATHAAR